MDLDLYTTKPKSIRAIQWDGSKASMYLIVGTLLSLGHEASIEDGYSSQGPDLINVQTKDGFVKAYPKDYVVKDGAYLTVMKPGDFEVQFERTSEEKEGGG